MIHSTNPFREHMRSMVRRCIPRYTVEAFERDLKEQEKKDVLKKTETETETPKKKTETETPKKKTSTPRRKRKNSDVKTSELVGIDPTWVRIDL